jgi:type I restriction enzyme S subunit
MKSGWQTKTLGEVLERTETVNPLQSPEREIDYIDVSSVSNQTFRIEETQRLKGKNAPSRARRLVRAKDIIFATVRPTLKRIAIVPDELDGQVCSTGYFVLRPKAGIDHRFVFYALFTEDFASQMENLQKGASYPAVTDGEVRAQPFAFPPLPEQQRIVGILDEAFAGLATARVNAQQNLRNARALFESHLQSVFSRPGDEWVETTLGATFDIGSSKRILETDWTSSGVPFYGGKEIVKLSKFGFVVSNAYISEEKYRDYASKYDMPRAGDVLITARGTIGSGYIVREGDKFYYKDGNIISFREKKPTNPSFLLYAFRSNPMIKQFSGLTGTTVRHLPIEKAKNLVLRIPSLASQNTIVEHLENMEKETHHLVAVYERKLIALTDLKKSFLHQAFTGQLTAA